MKYLGPKTADEDLATQSDVTGGGGAPLSDAAPDEITPDQAGAAGTSTDAARADHSHAIAAAAPSTTLSAATTNAEGNATSFARSNHTHAISTGTPGAIQPDDSASAGSSANLARADHQHSIAAAAASSITGTNAEGTSTSFARADHNHELGAGVVGATQLASTVSEFLVPTGSIVAWPTNTAPTGWIICDGFAASSNGGNGYSTTTFAALFAVIGYTYGGSSGTFYPPDLRGRVPVGRDANQAEFDDLNEKSGSKTHTLTTSEIPSHDHAISATQNTNTTVTGGGNRLSTLSNGTSGNNDATSASTGGGQSHNNLQPYIVLNYIIKT